MLKKHIKVFFILFSAVILQREIAVAQLHTLTPELISTMGGDTVLGNFYFSFTVGEIAVETATMTTGLSLTQGFHQPESDITVPVTIHFQQIVNTCIGASNGIAIVYASGGGSGTYRYIWSTGVTQDTTGIVTLSGLSKGDYTVTAISLSGDQRKSSGFTIIETDDCLLAASGLTPNGDGSNDYWKILNIDNVPNEVKVFNRWGSEVWAEKDYDNLNIRWIGSNNKNQMLPDGTYFYAIITNPNDAAKRKIYKGWVELTDSNKIQ